MLTDIVEAFPSVTEILSGEKYSALDLVLYSVLDLRPKSVMKINESVAKV
jgi:hypothetical protein